MDDFSILRFPENGRSYALGWTRRRDRGVFARRPIRSGEPILRFGGEVLPLSRISDFTHVLEIDTGLFLGPSGAADDYINHSCDPNCAVSIDTGGAWLVAVSDIAEGDELTFDYSTVLVTDPTEFPCSCDSSVCRRRITAFAKLPPREQRRLFEQGMVPGFALRAAGDPQTAPVQETGTD